MCMFADQTGKPACLVLGACVGARWRGGIRGVLMLILGIVCLFLDLMGFIGIGVGGRYEGRWRRGEVEFVRTGGWRP